MGNRFSWCCISNKFVIVVLALYSVALNLLPCEAAGQPTVPAIFIFGDSLFDVGTNDFLNGSLAKANVPYYGIDFPNSTATGRFSNGYNLADYLAMNFGFEKSPPPYLYLVNNIPMFNETIQQGVNFASAGSGVFDESGTFKWKVVVPLGEQIQQFAVVRGNLTELMGPDETAKMLSNSLFLISVGSNDIFDHFLYNKSLTKLQFVDAFRSSFRDHLQNLYDMGARKFAILGIAPLGCCPFARAINKTLGGNGGCLKEWNAVARPVHSSVNKLLLKMSSDLPDMKYSLGNMYLMTKFLLKVHESFGFTEIYWACCGNGDYNGDMLCQQASNPKLCSNRGEFVFWDAYHPSQRAANLSATILFSAAGTSLLYPINFRQLPFA